MSAPAPASRLLVVAGSAAESDELLEALVERSRRQAVELTLIVPASLETGGPAGRRGAGPDAARRRLRGALARFRAAGLYVREAGVGEGEPLLAVTDAVAAADVDEIVVASPPRRLWRRRGALGDRLRDATGLPVTQVFGRPARGRGSERDQSHLSRRSPASRGEEHRRARTARRRPAEPRRPSEAWLHSREPLPPVTPVVRLNLARGLAVAGFVLLALAVAGATNA